MKKNIIIAMNCLSAFLFLTQIGAWDALFIFLLVGAVPGTTLSISPVAMLTFTALALSVCTLLLIMNSDTDKNSKKPLPKKRYSRI